MRCSDFEPLPYPGEIPAYPYLVVRGEVVNLDQQAAPALDSTTTHIPLLSYGSNGCPGRLAQKFGLDVDDIWVTPALLHDATRAWCGEPAQSGVLAYTLASAPGAVTPIQVLWLPAGLAAQMDKTEGRRRGFYVVARLVDAQVEFPDGTRWANPLTYLGAGSRAPLSVDGNVQTVDGTSEGRARQWIESGHGQAAESALPRNTPIAAQTPLAEVAEELGADQPAFSYLEQMRHRL